MRDQQIKIDTGVKRIKTNDDKKKTHFKQTSIPLCSVKEALVVPEIMFREMNVAESTPLQVSLNLGLTPKSSRWRILSGASIAYGFTVGGWNAKRITLKESGKTALGGVDNIECLKAIREAVLRPILLKRFYNYYNGRPFPNDNEGIDTLLEWNIPRDRANNVLSLIKENAFYANFLVDIQGRQYIALDNVDTNLNNTSKGTEKNIDYDQLGAYVSKSDIKREITKDCNKVYISYKKNRKVIESLNMLLKYGSFEPVLHCRGISNIINLSDADLNVMSTCCAGIIDVDEEKTFFDTEGIKHKIFDDSVLVELGAVKAFYKDKVILLYHEGSTIPDNIKGVHFCKYKGDTLDSDAVLSLVKLLDCLKNSSKGYKSSCF